MRIAPQKRSCLCNKQMVRINYFGSAMMGGVKVKWQCPECKTIEIVTYSDQVDNITERCGNIVDADHFPQNDIELKELISGSD